jgi:hypothetical protein
MPLFGFPGASQPLYWEANLAEMPGFIGAGEGNRTLVISLEGFCSTIELHPRRTRKPDRRENSVSRPASKSAVTSPIYTRRLRKTRADVTARHAPQSL